jgi:hypothetical protein
MLFADEDLPAEAVAVLIGALVAGAVCGLWPLSAGARNGRPGLGVVGFVACVGSGVVLGCLLSLPTAAFFRILIGVLGHPEPPGGARPFNPYAKGNRSAF